MFVLQLKSHIILLLQLYLVLNKYFFLLQFLNLYLHWLFLLFFSIIWLLIRRIRIRIANVLRIWFIGIFAWSFLIPFYFWTHKFTFDFFQISNVWNVKKFLLINFLFSLIWKFMKAVEINLTYKRWVILMFKILGEYNLSEVPDIFNSKRSSFLLINY